MKIYKYSLKLVEHQVIKLPPESGVLKVEFQRGELFIWVIVNPEFEPTEDVEFWIVGTGHSLPETSLNRIYLDTVFYSDIVWHVFRDEPTKLKVPYRGPI